MYRIGLRSTKVTLGLAALALLSGVASAQQAPGPKKGGTAVVAVGYDATGLNPTLINGHTEVIVGCMVYEGLVVFNTTNDKPEPALAESWTISPDGKTYTFKLRKTNWHDGQPFTSEDVRYTLVDVAAKISPMFMVQAGKILETVETPDPQTAVLKLKEPYGPLLRLLTCAYSGAILPSHLFKGSDPNANPVTQKPVGTGPFLFSEWVRGDRVVVARNDKYWDQPKPYLDRVVAKVIPTAAGRTQALLAGEVDFIQGALVLASDRKTLENNPITKLELSGSAPNTLHGFFNLKRKPFDDVRVRNALLVATDRKYIFENIFYGSGRPGQAPWTTQVEWARDPAVDYDKSHPFNPEKAGQMLEEAGYKADANGVRFKVAITYTSTAAERAQIVLALKAMWKRAGVEVVPVPLELALLLPRVHQEANFDFYISSYNSYGDPAIGIALAYISSTIGANFGNAAHYNNPEVDTLFTKASALTSLEERGAIYRRIISILMRDKPAISLHENRLTDAASKKLKNAWGYAGAGVWSNAWLDR